MYNVIIGTAGHVDHGKTCLIKALTGVDTDRLAEEKKRGITIDLGFAEMPGDEGLAIGVIDVPGHEKFVKNMLAGIGGIDLVLLVVAADEGIMPQTVEHFEILKMLRIKRGLVVITKADLVEPEWMEIVRDDIEKQTEGTFLEDAPVIEVSAHTGHNIKELKELICRMVRQTEAKRVEAPMFRVPVDRVFTIDGFGTVVTGTLLEGAVSVGDEIAVYPAGKTAKVRNLQVHGSMVDRAYAGQRTALNLTNIKKDELRRGDVLAAKGRLDVSRMLDVKIEMFKDSPRTLVSGSRLHLYYGSAEVLCKAVLLDAEKLESGQSAFAQLRLEEEIAVRKGDRFILRFYSPVESIGGGVVLNSNPPKRKRYHEETLLALSVKEGGRAEEILLQTLLEESRRLPTLSDIGKMTCLTEKEIADRIKLLSQRGQIVCLTENIAVHASYWNEVKEKAAELLFRFHDEAPLRQGMPKEEFRKKIGEKLFLKQSKPVEILIDKMIEREIITDSGNIISAPGFRVTYTPEFLILKDKTEKEYRSMGVETPEANATEAMEALFREGRLVRLAYNCFIHKDCFEDAFGKLKSFIDENGKITLSEYRDLLSTSRKYAVRILEYLDQQKVTRLENEARVLDNKQSRGL